MNDRHACHASHAASDDFPTPSAPSMQIKSFNRFGVRAAWTRHSSSLEPGRVCFKCTRLSGKRLPPILMCERHHHSWLPERWPSDRSPSVTLSFTFIDLHSSLEVPRFSPRQEATASIERSSITAFEPPARMIYRVHPLPSSPCALDPHRSSGSAFEQNCEPFPQAWRRL